MFVWVATPRAARKLGQRTTSADRGDRRVLTISPWTKSVVDRHVVALEASS